MEKKRTLGDLDCLGVDCITRIILVRDRGATLKVVELISYSNKWQDYSPTNLSLSAVPVGREREYRVVKEEVNHHRFIF